MLIISNFCAELCISLGDSAFLFLKYLNFSNLLVTCTVLSF